MRRIDLAYLILATLTLLAGVVLSTGMGFIYDFRPVPVHLAFTLLVWASLTLFGLSYRAYPELAEATLALPQLVSAGAGALLLPVGIALCIAEVTLAVAAVSAFVWLAAIGMFLITLVETALAGQGASASGSRVTHGASHWRESL